MSLNLNLVLKIQHLNHPLNDHKAVWPGRLAERGKRLAREVPKFRHFTGESKPLRTAKSAKEFFEETLRSFAPFAVCLSYSE